MNSPVGKLTITFLVILMSCCFFMIPAYSMDRNEMEGLLKEGNEFFHKAGSLAGSDPVGARKNYGKAVMRFLRIAEEGGVKNGRLYYNIGNTYFLMGDIGRAILYYRRAKLIIPGDSNLGQNLAYARSLRKDKIDEKQQKKVLKTIFFWHYDFSRQTRLVLFTAFFALVWILAAFRLFIRKGVFSRGAILFAVLTALLLGSLLVDELGSTPESAGVVLAPETVARKGNGENYQPSFKDPLHAGTEFTIIENRDDWLHVELVDGRDCWIPKNSADTLREYQ